MTAIHIMLDLKTWGKRPGFDLRSIGACVFDPTTGHTPDPNNGGKEFSDCFYRATDNPLKSGLIDDYIPIKYRGIETVYDRKYPLIRDRETVAWWNDQSAEAQGAFAVPVDLREALRSFTNWLDGVIGSPDMTAKTWDNRDIRIWSHGPSFDVSILEAAYHAVGLPVPWHYRAPRDTRTAFDMADVGDHSAFMQRFNFGTAHNALDDAISQARAVCEAFTVVQKWQIHYGTN